MSKLNLLLKTTCLLSIYYAIACDISFASEDSASDYADTLNSLFQDQAVSFGGTLPGDEVVRWKFIPAPSARAGLFVFISPTPSGLPPPNWRETLSARNLHWIAAENFGNEKPTAQRVLTAVMGLRVVEREFDLDRKRIYIGGMSGGGRAASTAITTFPQLFSGALYIVGADPWTDDAQRHLPQIQAKRYVFLTGRQDFNRDEMKSVYRRYVTGGAKNVLLMDLRHFGHQYPSSKQLDQALAFLDGDSH